MIDTAGTISNAAKVAREKGALSVIVAATHGVLSGDAVQRLSSDDIDKVIVADTVKIPKEKRFKKLRVVPSARIFSETINRIHTGESVSALFGEDHE
jgi:ribose-phosphate pyrophosphokinase